MGQLDVYFADGGVAKTGLSPTFDSLNEADGGGAVATGGFTITETGGGWYRVTGMNIDEKWVGVMNSNDGTMSDVDRYIPVAVAPADFGFQAFATVVFNETSDSLKFGAFLTKNGQAVQTLLTAAEIKVYDDGHALLFTITVGAIFTNGVAFLTKSAPGLVKNKIYYYTVAITQDGVTYTSLEGMISIE